MIKPYKRWFYWYCPRTGPPFSGTKSTLSCVRNIYATLLLFLHTRGKQLQKFCQRFWDFFWDFQIFFVILGFFLGFWEFSRDFWIFWWLFRESFWDFGTFFGISGFFWGFWDFFLGFWKNFVKDFFRVVYPSSSHFNYCQVRTFLKLLLSYLMVQA